MGTVLVVDESEIDRRVTGNLLENGAGLSVAYAANGREALITMGKLMPDIVVTGLQMAEMNGLELVRAIRSQYPSTPVILTTAHGSEEIAVQALQSGAASYVPKRSLAEHLVQTVGNVLEVVGARREQQRVLECLTEIESHFVLDNDLSLVAPFVGHVEENIARMRLCDETTLIQVSVALREALLNAMYHGNLEIDSELRHHDVVEFYQLAEARRRQEPYRNRRVHLTVKASRSQVVYVIRDEGPGFIAKSVQDPTDRSNLTKVSGRGLLLIRTFLDEVYHNERGNEITMIKHRDR